MGPAPNIFVLVLAVILTAACFTHGGNDPHSRSAAAEDSGGRRNIRQLATGNTLPHNGSIEMDSAAAGAIVNKTLQAAARKRTVVAVRDAVRHKRRRKILKGRRRVKRGRHGRRRRRIPADEDIRKRFSDIIKRKRRRRGRHGRKRKRSRRFRKRRRSRKGRKRRGKKGRSAGKKRARKGKNRRGRGRGRRSRRHLRRSRGKKARRGSRHLGRARKKRPSRQLAESRMSF